MLPAAHRLTDSASFAQTVRSGRRAGSRTLVVHLAAAGSQGVRAGDAVSSPARAGLVVSKAVGNAVVRTRVKRRLRHQLASRIQSLPDGATLVVRALPPAATASSVELGKELDRGLDRCLQDASVEPQRRPEQAGIMR